MSAVHTGTYLNCGNTYSFCSKHNNAYKEGYCPSCDKKKFCTRKKWQCSHVITRRGVKYTCGHVLDLCSNCYCSIIKCPVLGGKDSGNRTPENPPTIS